MGFVCLYKGKGLFYWETIGPYRAHKSLHKMSYFHCISTANTRKHYFKEFQYFGKSWKSYFYSVTVLRVAALVRAIIRIRGFACAHHSNSHLPILAFARIDFLFYEFANSESRVRSIRILAIFILDILFSVELESSIPSSTGAPFLNIYYFLDLDSLDLGFVFAALVLVFHAIGCANLSFSL